VILLLTNALSLPNAALPLLDNADARKSRATAQSPKTAFALPISEAFLESFRKSTGNGKT